MLEEEMNTSQDQIAQGRLENLREFVGVAKEFESIADEPDLETFLTRISLVSDLDTANFSEDAVKLMTIHSAKGLEFPIVFLVGLEEGLFPHVRSLNSPAAMEEERRLMYVAITRAADLLHVTLARKRMSFTGNSGLSSNYAIPSRFLQEMAPEYLQGYYPDASRGKSAEKQVEEQWLDDGSFGYPSRNKPQAPHSYGRSDYQKPSTGGYSRPGSGDYARPNGAARPNNNSPRDRHPSSQPQAPKRAMRMAPAQAQQILESRESSVSGNTSYERMNVGDTVQHAKFGLGKILQVIGENDKELYNIEFQSSGKRLLDPRFAKLTKLN
jgi:DNA helicase-2/ATP-dependent DNA helicase PcrA